MLGDPPGGIDTISTFRGRQYGPAPVRLPLMRFHPATLRGEVNLRFPKCLVELGYTASEITNMRSGRITRTVNELTGLRGIRIPMATGE